MAKKKTKSRKVLEFIKRRSENSGTVSVREIRQYIAKLNGLTKAEFEALSGAERNKIGQSILYGTSKQHGLLTLCRQNSDRQYYITFIPDEPPTRLKGWANAVNADF